MSQLVLKNNADYRKESHYRLVKVEGIMEIIKQERRKKWAVEILESDLSSLDKERKLVALGYEEEEADNMVNGIYTNKNQLVYYEKLPNPDYAEED